MIMTDNKKIKRITYTPMYGCYGFLDEIRHLVVTLTSNSVKYSIVPLAKPSSKNCKIDFSFKIQDNKDNAHDDTYSNEWDKLSEAINALEKEPNDFFCTDCMPTSVKVTYEDGTHKAFYDCIDNGAVKQIAKTAKEFMPSIVREYLKNNRINSI